MAKWYCVTSTFDDRGRVTACITDVKEQDQRPVDIFKSTSRKDIYINWYGSKAEADEMVEAAKKA